MNTGEKIVSAEFSNSITENLERRFAALEKINDSYNLFSAERSYIDYLERERRLHPIIKALFAERAYNDVWLHIICVFTLTIKGYTGTPKVPGFLEELYPQGVTWNSLETSENGRLDIAYYSAIGESGSVGEERAHQNTLSLMRRLHHDLLEKLSENASVAVAGSKTKFANGVLLKKIEELVFKKCADGDRKTSLAVNGDFENLLRVDVRKGSWKLLYHVAEMASGNVDIDLEDAGRNKPAKDFFNHNKGCKLYSQTGCKLTNILKTDGGFMEPAVKMEVITHKAFQQRKNKLSRKSA